MIIDEFELRKVAAYKAISTLPSFDMYADQLTIEDIERITTNYFICTTCNECLPNKVKAMSRMCEACHAKCD